VLVIAYDTPYIERVKRLLVIAFLGVYLLLSAGFTLLVHTCSGYTTVTPMPLSSEDPCGCGEEESARCCTVELRDFLISDAQKAASTESLTTTFAALQVLPAATFSILEDGGISAPVIGPSPPIHTPLTLLHCSLLI
jgi:hypothetical protein